MGHRNMQRDIIRPQAVCSLFTPALEAHFSKYLGNSVIPSWVYEVLGTMEEPKESFKIIFPRILQF